MFDVLVFLYENYWRPDACPDAPQLRRKLSAVGFENDEIQEALLWLDGLATHTQQAIEEPKQGWPEQSALGQRHYTEQEREVLGEDSLSFIGFLESAGVLPAPMREVVIDRAMAAGDTPLDIDDLKVIVLMVFWSLGEEPDALILDELSVAAEDRQLH
jgi:Smg protein